VTHNRRAVLAALGLSVAVLVFWLVPAREGAVLRYLREHPAFLNQHPELLEQAAQAAEMAQRIQGRAAARSVLQANRTLLDDPLVPQAGAADGDLLLIEFSDYRCPPCRSSTPHLMTLLREDRRLRVLFLPLPLFGQESELAARAAFAAHLQARFLPMHEWLMNAPVIDRRTLLAQLPSVGLDTDRFLADLDDPRLPEMVERTQALARQLGIEGPPAFIVGDLPIRGGIDGPLLLGAVLLARCFESQGVRADSDAACLNRSQGDPG